MDRVTKQQNRTPVSDEERRTTSDVDITSTPSVRAVSSEPQASESRPQQNADSDWMGKVRERAGEQLTNQKNRATEGIGTIAHAVRNTTQELREQKHDTIAEYVTRAADELDQLSQRLRKKDVGELFRDAQNLARRQPVMFVGSAFVLGLLGARFLKSSPPHSGSQQTWRRPVQGVNVPGGGAPLTPRTETRYGGY